MTEMAMKPYCLHMPLVETRIADGAAIRERRKALDLSRPQLAKRMRPGRSAHTIRNLERGAQAKISLVLADEIAAALGLNPEDIFKREPAA